MIRLNRIKAAVALAALCCVAQSHAATIDVHASASLTDVTTTGTATFTITGGFYLGTAFVNDVSPFFESDFYAGLAPGGASVNAFIGGGFAAASAFAGESSGDSGVLVNVAGNAFGSSLSEMGFELDGVGEVMLTFGALLLLDIDGATGLEFGEAAVTITDSFGAYEDVFVFGDGALGDVSLLVPAVLMLTYTVDGFSTGFFSIETVAFADLAPIPIPAALWLFSGGLMMLFGIRRRPN